MKELLMFLFKKKFKPITYLELEQKLGMSKSEIAKALAIAELKFKGDIHFKFFGDYAILMFGNVNKLKMYLEIN